MEEENKQPSEGEIRAEAVAETSGSDIPEAVAVSDAPVESPYKNGFLRGLDNFYGVTQKRSSIRVEIFAGIATFLAMCYILVVNPFTDPVLLSYLFK